MVIVCVTFTSWLNKVKQRVCVIALSAFVVSLVARGLIALIT
jgi:hypothetical protein